MQEIPLRLSNDMAIVRSAYTGGLIAASITFLLLFSTVPAKAVTIMGTGVESCGTWLQHRSEGPYGDLQWVLGYLFGAAIWGSKDSLRWDANVIWYWLDNYCQSHPVAKLSDALAAIIHQPGAMPC